MNTYSIFGGSLRSALELPALPASAAPDETWSLRVHSGAPPAPAGALLGTEEVDPGCTVRMHHQANGLRLAYDDTGTFDILEGGREITWYRPEGAPEELARLDIIGRVLATALHLEGVLALHGSGVAIGEQAVAFVAPKTFGKSSLALALVNAGARFISDDTLPVEPGPVPVVRPGVDHVRLCGDSADRLTASDAGLTNKANGAKVTLPMRDRGASSADRTPLAAVYLLSPAPAGATDAARRARLASVPAAVALVRHAKIGGLLRGREAARLLDQATEVARTVPVYLLEVARDLDRLGEAADAIMGWHSGLQQAGDPGTMPASSRPAEHSAA